MPAALPKPAQNSRKKPARKKPVSDDFIDEILEEPRILADVLGYSKVVHDIHRDWIVDLWRPGNELLQAHRNSYKTTCRVIGIIWGLLFDPDKRIMLIRKTATAAQATVWEVMQHYEKPALRAIYNHMYGVEEPRDIRNWSKSEGMQLAVRNTVTKERNLEPAGINISITGSHYDLIIADDIVTENDRYSPAEREKTKRAVRELENILNADGIGIKYSGTPWHEDDAYSMMPEPNLFPVTLNFIPELTEEKLRHYRETQGESLFRANYYLEHIASEDRPFAGLKFDRFEYEYAIGFLDPAFGDGKKNDFSALSVVTYTQNKIYVIAGYVWQKQIDDTYNATEAIYKKHDLSFLVVEDNQAQVAVANELKRRGMIIDGQTQLKNKHQRIMHYVKGNWPNIYFEHEVDAAYLKQIAEYVNPVISAHDDAPDSLAGAIQRLITPAAAFQMGFLEL